MTLKTLFRFLFGDKDAIVIVAETKSALWLGLVFVFSAGFAREYDGEYLLREPWHLFLPLVASALTSFILFCLLTLPARKTDKWTQSFWSDYRRFLTLYWMTAPLAWLYAIPVERFLTAAQSTEANLWFLGVVALWRVLLMIRIISVIWDISVPKASHLVIFFGDAVLLVLLFVTPLPVFSIMGGIRLSDSEQMIQATAFISGFFGYLTMPYWILAVMFITFKFPLSRKLSVNPESNHEVSRGLWSIAGFSIIVWVLILPFTQTEQARRYRAEFQLRDGEIRSAIAYMNHLEESDFPPHWDAPPQLGYGERKPHVLDVMEIIISQENADWVNRLYESKFQDWTGGTYSRGNFWYTLAFDRVERTLKLLDEMGNQSFIDENLDAIESIAEKEDFTDRQKDTIREFLSRHGKKEKENEEALKRFLERRDVKSEQKNR